MRYTSCSVVLCSVLLIIATASETLAQSTTRVQRRDPVRRAVIDLEAQAKARRAGQVMPGDEAPVVSVPDVTTSVDESDTGTDASPDVAAPAIDLFEDEPSEEAPPEQSDTTQPSAPVAAAPPASAVPDPVSELSDTIAPASVRVVSVDGLPGRAQWSLDTAQQRWQALTTQSQSIGVVTVRTGPATRLHVALHRDTQVTISSLSKVQLGTVTRKDGSQLPYIRVIRGSAEVQPASELSPGRVSVAVEAGENRSLISVQTAVSFDAIDGAAINSAQAE